ncbi:hypothetical protein FRC11_009145 [Ceratobasidium sp. 423]|nr:hypothetical protein FRC11_009145 [Ceratobasidium sp. 423]
MANLMDADTANLWDDSASIAPSNLASQYGTYDASHSSGFTRQRSPPNPGRNKRQRIDTDDVSPTESLFLTDANDINDELLAFLNIDPQCLVDYEPMAVDPLMYQSDVGKGKSGLCLTITFGDSLAPQADRSTPPLHSSNPNHREVRPVIEDDEQSSDNSTKVSSFVPSNPDSGLHSHPLVSSGTPPTSAPRHNQQLIRHPSTLANSMTNEAAKRVDIDFVRSRITNIENNINHLQAAILNTSAEAEEERRLMAYKTVREIARSELDGKLENARREMKLALKIMETPGMKEEGLRLYEEAKKEKVAAFAISYDEQTYLVARRLNVNIGQPHNNYYPDQQTHTLESNRRPPSAQTQSVVSTLSSPVQVASPSRRPPSAPSASHRPSARPNLRRTATSRAAASPSSAPLTIPSPAPDAQVASWVEHQGSDSTL